MESSRGDFFSDMAEHRAMSKNDHNVYYPRFSFIYPEQVYHSLKWVFCFHSVSSPATVLDLLVL